jgi:hypothetical protein
MLDLPIVSSQDNEELVFEAFADRIPALGTPVTVILEPIRQAKKKKTRWHTTDGALVKMSIMMINLLREPRDLL